jgi:hypothetical protein
VPFSLTLHHRVRDLAQVFILLHPHFAVTDLL